MSPAALAALLGVTLLLLDSGCATDQPAEAEPRDPSLATLDRLLEREARGAASTFSPEGCLTRLEAQGLCPRPRTAPRALALRIVLDARYPRQWAAWEERLGQTLACVNTFYRRTGIQWQVTDVATWDPGSERHQLYALLDRLQREHPADQRSVVLGISVWEERKVFSTAGGEIGLSQGAACVVPSWPRVENDCLILTHELGHLVGARHVPGKEWIMGWAARPFHLPATDPIARVVATYRWHPRNEATIRAHQLARFTPHGLRLPARCARWVEAQDRCWRLP